MKVGVVGCGNIAASHLPHILKHKSVQSVSITDVNYHKAQQIAKRFRLNNIYDDFDTMLREHRPGVVHILTPPATHAQLAIKAMEFGSHVLVEKPMALTLEEADAMIVAARKNNVKLCVDHNNLWEPLMMKARKLVEEDKVGRLIHVDVSCCFDIKRLPIPVAGSSTKIDWLLHLPGGLVLDLIPQPASILLHFLKEPVKIWANAKSGGILSHGLPDELRVLFSAANVTGYLSISLGIKPDCMTINIYGTEMSIHVNLTNMTLITRKNRDIPKKILRPLDNIEQAAQLLTCTCINGFKVLMGKLPLPDDVGSVITRFYKSIENNSDPPITGEDGRAVVKVCEQILEQIK